MPTEPPISFAHISPLPRELLAVPEDLRTVLEQCLAEDATAENLEIYLPEVRQIITGLLQGLRGKQSIYRRIVSDHKHRSGGGSGGGGGDSGHERTASSSSRSDRTSRRDGSHRQQLSRSIPEEERQEVVNGAASGSRRNGNSRSSRREVNSQATSSSSQHTADDQFVGGFAPAIVEQRTGPSPEADRPTTPQPKASSSPPDAGPPQLTLSYPGADKSPATSDHLPPVEPPAAPIVPASVKRYSLVDRPAAASPPPPPSVNVEPSSPDPGQINGTFSPSGDHIPLDPATPAVASSLEALKNDVIQRRASKRFSTFNISKMTGASTSRAGGGGSLRGHPHRRSLVAANSTPSANDLAVLTEADEEAETASPKEIVMPELPQEPPKALPAVPTPARTPETKASPAPDASSGPTRITVFLQLGREVKKANIEPGLSFSSLRVLFVDKFSYNPGQENFPAIYIRDPSSGVQYELEDVDEVKDKCLLSLNIEREFFVTLVPCRRPDVFS